MDPAAEEFVIIDSAGHTMIDVEALRAAEEHGEDADSDDDRDEGR